MKPRDRYAGVLRNYLVPTFGKLCLRDLTKLTIQRYFAGMAEWKLSQESKDKIRDVLSSVLGSAVEFDMLVINPAAPVKLPADRHGHRRNKPIVKPEQFEKLSSLIAEPYATMVYVAIYTGCAFRNWLA